MTEPSDGSWDPALEIDNVIQALRRADAFLTRYDELDAARHLATDLAPGPLTQAVRQGRASADRVASYLYGLHEGERDCRRYRHGDPGE